MPGARGTRPPEVPVPCGPARDILLPEALRAEDRSTRAVCADGAAGDAPAGASPCCSTSGSISSGRPPHSKAALSSTNILPAWRNA